MDEHRSHRELAAPAEREPDWGDDPLIPVFIPPLVAILWKLEKERGAPLSEAEVLAIRDGAVCMTMRRSMARKLAESRGYDDLEPEDVWQEWQAVRAQLASEDDA